MQIFLVCWDFIRQRKNGFSFKPLRLLKKCTNISNLNNCIKNNKYIIAKYSQYIERILRLSMLNKHNEQYINITKTLI